MDEGARSPAASPGRLAGDAVLVVFMVEARGLQPRNTSLSLAAASLEKQINHY
jgi:hypothetical protein